MADTRADIRRLVRNRLMAWPDFQTTLNGGITDTATAVVVASGTGITSRALLEIEDETLRVQAGDNTVNLTCLRGDRGTTAASHLTGTAVKCYPYWGWTDSELNDLINLAIDWLFPEVWYPKLSEVTVAAYAKEFGMPADTVYPTAEQVKVLEFYNNDSTPRYVPVYNWEQRADRIILSRCLDGTARGARITTHGRQARLTADNQSLQYNEWTACVVSRACGLAQEALLSNRVRYVEYSASLNDRAADPDLIQREIYYFFNQATIEKERISRPPMSGFASTRRSS